MERIGIDLGGTKIEGVLLSPANKILIRKRVATEAEKGYDAILNRIVSLCQELKAASSQGILKYGIGTPGAISPRTGLLKNSNTVCLNGMPFKQDLEKRLGHAIEIQNDANCFALAEALLGAGRGFRTVFGVILGTGCGGGIVIESRVRTGRQSIAGEWGHMTIDPNGPDCYCGKKGCVETWISGGGAERRFRERFGKSMSFQDITEAWRGKDPDAQIFMEEYFDLFGRSLSNVLSVLDPDGVVLGGGLSNVLEFYSRGVEAVRKYIFSDSLETPILKNQLGDSAGVIGAALIGI